MDISIFFCYNWFNDSCFFKFFWIVTIWYLSFIFIGSDFSDSLMLYIRHFVFCVNLTTRCRYIHISHLYSFNQDTSYITIYGNKKEDGKHIGSIFFIYYLLLIIHIIDKKIFIFHTNMLCDTSIHFIP